MAFNLVDGYVTMEHAFAIGTDTATIDIDATPTLAKAGA
jgi:hypothetical protein